MIEFDFRPLEYIFWIMLAVCVISVPLAVWKIIDIIAWVVNNVSISW